MIRFKPLPLMSLLSIIAFAVLISFGRWQWEKYEIKSAAAEEPVAEMTIASYQPVESGIQFARRAPDTHEQGWRVFTPVKATALSSSIVTSSLARTRCPDEVRASGDALWRQRGASIAGRAGPFTAAASAGVAGMRSTSQRWDVVRRLMSRTITLPGPISAHIARPPTRLRRRR